MQTWPKTYIDILQSTRFPLRLRYISHLIWRYEKRRPEAVLCIISYYMYMSNFNTNKYIFIYFTSNMNLICFISLVTFQFCEIWSVKSCVRKEMFYAIDLKHMILEILFMDHKHKATKKKSLHLKNTWK